MGSVATCAMFTYSTQPRGSVVHAAALAEALTARGLLTTLFAIDKTGAGFYRPVRTPLQLVPAGPAAGVGSVLVRQRIAELSGFLARASGRFEVYHAQDCLTASALFKCPASYGRVVRTVHHVEAFTDPYLRECQARSIRESDIVCAVSRSTAADLVAQFGRRATVVGNGVDPDRTKGIGWSSVAAARARLLGDSSGPLLLSFGGVEPRKNSLLSLSAFELLKSRFPGAKWVVVGGASVLDHAVYREEFERRVAGSPFGDDVLRLGVVEESAVGVLLCAADVLINPSQQEGFGLASLEAAAAGCPLVVSYGRPFDEYLSEESAFFADKDDARSIADALAAALRHGSERRLAAREVALRHGWAEVAELSLQMYSELRGAGGAPRPFTARASGNTATSREWCAPCRDEGPNA